MGAKCEVCQRWSLRAARQKERHKVALCSGCAVQQKPLPEAEQQENARRVEPERIIPVTALQLIEEWGRQ